MLLVIDPQPALLALAGVAAGLVLLGRGFAAYRRAGQIAGTATSPVASMAVGEVRVSGIVETAEVSLVSPLQSAACIYYRSSIHEKSDRSNRTLLEEERAVGFRVRDETGSVRIFPNGARFDVPDCFSDGTGPFGDQPAGLMLRSGSAIAAAEPDRASQVAALLTVRPAAAPGRGMGAEWSPGLLGMVPGPRDASAQYREARIEPGQTVTVVGRALPFEQLPDPMSADLGGTDPMTPGDPEIAADLAAARAAGLLAPNAEMAWGNAAIAGFGVGRPVTPPKLDPDAHRLPLATASQAEGARRRFEIDPGELVLASAPDARLAIALGPPGSAVGRAEGVFLVGLLGAVLAIASAVALALIVQGGVR